MQSYSGMRGYRARVLFFLWRGGDGCRPPRTHPLGKRMVSQHMLWGTMVSSLCFYSGMRGCSERVMFLVGGLPPHTPRLETWWYFREVCFMALWFPTCVYWGMHDSIERVRFLSPRLKKRWYLKACSGALCFKPVRLFNHACVYWDSKP